MLDSVIPKYKFKLSFSLKINSYTASFHEPQSLCQANLVNHLRSRNRRDGDHVTTAAVA